MYNRVPEYVVNLSKELRRNATKPEDILWEYLRNRRLNNLKFRRQHPIERYIADFYCHELNLIIEIDGGIHNKKDVKEYDQVRESELKSGKINILRFTNEEILLNMDDIIKQILKFSPRL